MAIEDLFKIVKERFVAEQPAVPASQEGDVEICLLYTSDAADE